MAAKAIGFLAACKKFFGYQLDKGAKDFAAEMKALTYDEKVQLWHMMNDATTDEAYRTPCDMPTVPKVAA